MLTDEELRYYCTVRSHDVSEMAREILELRDMKLKLGQGFFIVDQVQLRERNRCAGIAEKHDDVCEVSYRECNCADAIANAIRSGEAKEQGE